jgi:integrase
MHAVHQFLDWVERRDLELRRGTTCEVGEYLQGLELAVPTVRSSLSFIYTAARVGAVAKLTMKSLKHDGTQYPLRFTEKSGKSREIPVRHDLEQFLFEHIQAAEITEGPLFRTANRKMKTLTKNALTGIDVCRMMKRRLKDAGLPTNFSLHSFRMTTVTDLLE